MIKKVLNFFSRVFSKSMNSTDNDAICPHSSSVTTNSDLWDEQISPNKSRLSENDTITFYHASANLQDSESFIKEGAKPIGKGKGGQTDGFFAWTQAVGIFYRLLLFNIDKGLVVRVQEKKGNITYPVWQLDTESDMGCLFKDIMDYTPFFEKHAHDLNIPVPDGADAGTEMVKITSMHLLKKEFAYYHQNNVILKGITRENEKVYYNLPLYHSQVGKNFMGGAEETGFRQIFVDYLCQNCPGYQEKYNQHMHKCIVGDMAHAIKYTAEKPLPVYAIDIIDKLRTNKIRETTKTIYRAQALRDDR